MATANLDPYLEERPLPLVALVGCVHLHGSLMNRRAPPDEIHARYLSLPEDTSRLDHVSSSTEERDTVVLKRDWLHKHTFITAPVVALWFIWDAETSIAAIVTRLEGFRSRCRPSCKIVLVLVQTPTAAGAPFGPLSSPAKDDERLNALRKAADLDTRSLLLIVHQGGEGEGATYEDSSVRRVERTLLESALSYYKDESRNNKKVKQLGSMRSGAPHLLARHHFKRAYYSEVRRDASAAAKHWQACSSALRDLLRTILSPVSEAEHSLIKLSEVKRVAEFVNRKICLSAFGALRLAEACESFRKHIRLFRPLIQAPGRLSGASNASATSLSSPTAAVAGHVHWGWLGKQYRAFARSLEIANGAAGGSAARSAASSLVHPQYLECGYYYQAAARCAFERRKCAEKLVTAGSVGGPSPDGSVSAGAPSADAPGGVLFEGQTVTDIAAELGVAAEVSAAADSANVIELLTKAYEHYKQSRQLRMILFLATQMAEEYFYAHNYAMAKRFFERVAKTYQKEQWYTVVSHIQHCLRVCAQQLGVLHDFISTSVALLSSRLSTAAAAAQILLELLAVVRIAPPAELAAVADASTPPLLAGSMGASSPLPAAAPFPPLASAFALELDGSQSLLSCTASWSILELHLGDSAVLELVVRSHLATPLTVTSMRLAASDPALSLTLTSVPPDPAESDGESATSTQPKAAVKDGAPLHLDAGSTLTFKLPYSPTVASTVDLLSFSVILGEEPCALVISLPITAAGEASETSRLTVTLPPPDLKLVLSHPPSLFQHEATVTMLNLIAGLDAVHAATLSISLVPVESAEDMRDVPLGADDDSHGELPMSQARLTPAIITTPGKLRPSANLAEMTPSAVESAGLAAPAAETTPSSITTGITMDGTPSLETTGQLPILLDESGTPLPSTIPLPDLPPGKEYAIPVHMLTYEAGCYQLVAIATYARQPGVPARTVTVSFDLMSVPALAVSSSIALTTNQRQRGFASPGETVDLVVRVASIAPAPASIVLHAVSVSPSSGGDEADPAILVADGTGMVTEVGGCVMPAGAEYSALFRLSVTRTFSAMPLGDVEVKWARAQWSQSGSSLDAFGVPVALAGSLIGSPDDTGDRLASVSVPLPTAEVKACEFELKWNLPTEGSLGEMLSMSVTICNRTKSIRSLKIAFSENEAFLFCGLKLYHFRLPPTFSQTFTFNLVPIKTGTVNLPMPKVQCETSNTVVADSTSRHRIFVRPTEPSPDITQSVSQQQISQSA